MHPQLASVVVCFHGDSRHSTCFVGRLVALLLLVGSAITVQAEPPREPEGSAAQPAPSDGGHGAPAESALVMRSTARTPPTPSTEASRAPSTEVSRAPSTAPYPLKSDSASTGNPPPDELTKTRRVRDKGRVGPRLVALTGAGLIAAGIATGLAGLAPSRKIGVACLQGSCSEEDRTYRDRTRRLSQSGDAFLFGGVLGAAAGFAWFLVERRSEKRGDAPATMVGPSVTATHAGIQIRGDF